MQEESNKRYATVRRQLDQIGYKQKLDVESLALVERMISDLRRATEVVSCSSRDLRT